MRLDTFAAALRHPEPDAAAKEGVGISIILSEADPVGLFVATSVSEPVLHGGVLVSVFAYLLYLQPWMALVALTLFVPQCFFVPLVQNAINRRTESRIQVMRRLSADIVAETADGVLEREERSYRQRVHNIYTLNMQIYRRKYSMNFLINLLYHLGTVGILFVGGWFVMQGKTGGRHRGRVHLGAYQDQRPVERPRHLFPRHDQCAGQIPAHRQGAR